MYTFLNSDINKVNLFVFEFAEKVSKDEFEKFKSDFDNLLKNNNFQLLSLHPGVSIDNVIENTGFDVMINSDEVTQMPTSDELACIREVLDPQGIRNSIFGE